MKSHQPQPSAGRPLLIAAVLFSTLMFITACKPPLALPVVTLNGEHNLSFGVATNTADGGIVNLVHKVSINANTSEDGDYSWTIDGTSPSSADVTAVSQSATSLSFTVPTGHTSDYTVEYTLSNSGGSAVDSIDVSANPLDYDRSDSNTDFADPLGAAGGSVDLYFVYHNLGTSTVSNSISVNGSVAAAAAGATPRSVTPPIRQTSTDEPTVLPPPAVVTDFNANPPLNDSTTSRAVFTGEPTISKATVNDSATFKVDGSVSGTSSLTATLRWQYSKTTAFGSKTVNIWVDNAWWTPAGGESQSPSMTVANFTAADDTSYEQASDTTTTLAELMGEAFFSTTDDHDIYNLDTAVLGDEWGTTGYSNLIGDTNTIDILLYDIDADYDHPTSEGRTLGYFWSKDNFTASQVSYSNERIMFYMDAPFLHYTENFWGNPDGSFDPNYPKELLISTLAHEFQHMINFYQRQVVQGRNDGTWMNEMMSMMMEDLAVSELDSALADSKFSTDFGSFSLEPPTDRLPWFLYYDDDSLTGWPGTYGSYGSAYAISYAYGAYLLRNYGGPQILHDLMYSASDDTKGVTAALAGAGGPDFQTSLRNWSTAVLASDGSPDPGSPESYFGNGAETFGGQSYTLSDINLMAYKQVNTGTSGPWIYADPASFGSSIPVTTNIYTSAATSISTTTAAPQTFTLKLPIGVEMTAMIK